MTGFERQAVALLPVDVLRQSGVNFACRWRVSDIKRVIFNDPATVVLWKDGTKTVVKCSENDEFNPEIGLAMAICKKSFGNTGAYNEVFKKWVYGVVSKPIAQMREELAEFCRTVNCNRCALDEPVSRCGCGAFFTIPKGQDGYMTDDEIRNAYSRVFEK